MEQIPKVMMQERMRTEIGLRQDTLSFQQLTDCTEL
jgi:hypothetical protein